MGGDRKGKVMNEQEASVLMGTAIVGPVLLKFSDADLKLISCAANLALQGGEG